VLQFRTHLAHNLRKINRTESYEKDSFIMCLNLSLFLNFCHAIGRAGAGAGAASKILPGAGAA
jgi:hypothetical protein